MGTNYYLKRIPTQEEIEKTKRLLDEGKIESQSGYSNWDPEKDVAAQDMIEQMIKEIHIGKSSYGWQFTFRVNKDLYKNSQQACFDYIKKAIESGKWKFIDEYGNEESLDEFIKHVNQKIGGYTFKTDPNKNKYYHYIENTNSISEDGSWWVDNEFC